jgi:F-type H+-transporting ATPase subunit epsilon
MIKFEITTPERVVLKEEVKQVTVPTREGEITILPGHIPLVSILDPGVIEVLGQNDNHHIFSLSGGFIEVLRDKVVILADTAERAEEIDIEEVERAMNEARETLNNLRREDKERFANINAGISREMARSKAVKRWKKIKQK